MESRLCETPRIMTENYGRVSCCFIERLPKRFIFLCTLLRQSSQRFFILCLHLSPRISGEIYTKLEAVQFFTKCFSTGGFIKVKQVQAKSISKDFYAS